MATFYQRLQKTSNSKLQLKIANNGRLTYKMCLLRNPNLHPDVFKILFSYYIENRKSIDQEFGKFDVIISTYKYNNPKTQNLLDTYLTLI